MIFKQEKYYLEYIYYESIDLIVLWNTGGFMFKELDSIHIYIPCSRLWETDIVYIGCNIYIIYIFSILIF